jgi:aromatic ring hydroxylase
VRPFRAPRTRGPRCHAAKAADGAAAGVYERFFFGDPVRMMSALYNVYDKEPLMQRVRAFLARDDAPSA